MSTNIFVWAKKAICVTVLLILLFLNWKCSGQVSKEQKAQRDTLVDSMPVPGSLPIFGIKLQDSPIRQAGYVFLDSTGKEIKFISEEEIFAINPYKKINLKPEDGGKDGYFRSYPVHNLSLQDIKSSLPGNLRTIPPDDVLKKIGVIHAFVGNCDYDVQNPQYLMVVYVLIMYGAESMTEEWAETTIQVYNNNGELISTIKDNCYLQGTYISSDGRYILANEMFGRIGDGWSEVDEGLAVYDVEKSNLIGKIINENGIYYTDVTFAKYERGHFLLYAKLYKDIENSDVFTLSKLVINPAKKNVYQKIVEAKLENLPPLQIKSNRYPSGEDLSTYELLHF